MINIAVAKPLSTPPLHIAQALSDDFLKTVNIGVSVDVVLVKLVNKKWAAKACLGSFKVARPTIEFNTRWANPSKDSNRPSIEGIQAVYLHEVAHLLVNEGHTLYFAAVQAVLYQRAGVIDNLSFYDVQDVEVDKQGSSLYSAKATAEFFATDDRQVLDMLEDIKRKSDDLEWSIRAAPSLMDGMKKTKNERDVAEEKASIKDMWLKFWFFAFCAMGLKLLTGL